MFQKTENLLALFFLAGIALRPVDASVADNLIDLAGNKQVKVVWVHATNGNLGGWRKGTSDILMGFDTDNGTEHAILSTVTNYSRPLISRDGSMVIYTNQSQTKAYRVNWNGSGQTELAEGFAGCLWYDKNSGKEYAIVAQGCQADARSCPIYRVNILDPADRQMIVASRDVTADWLCISADGSRVGGAWPWSSCGVVTVGDGSYRQYGSGCVTSMPYDNSYRFAIFNGAHTGWNIHNESGGSHFLNLRPPGIAGQVYHCKFASWDPGFLVLTGEGADCPSNVYVGKVNSDLTLVSNWVQVTSSGKAGPCDVWIGATAVQSSSVQINAFTVSPLAVAQGESAILSWQTSNATAVAIDKNIGTVGTQGTVNVSPAVSTVYTLSAHGENGPVSAQVTLSVVPLREPDSAENATQPGVRYEYYEGDSWQSLPDFQVLTPVREGIIESFVVPAGVRADGFAVRYSGFLLIPDNGLYTFWLLSDDGSRLYIGDHLVVDNNKPFWAFGQAREGAIGLRAGKHAITVSYHEIGGGEQLEVRYSGPDGIETTIPSTSLFSAPDNPAITLLAPLSDHTRSVGDTLLIQWETDTVQISGGVALEFAFTQDGPWTLIRNSAVQLGDTLFGNYPFVIPQAVLGQSLVGADIYIKVRGYFQGDLYDITDIPIRITEQSLVRRHVRQHPNGDGVFLRAHARGLLIEPGLTSIARVYLIGLDGSKIEANQTRRGSWEVRSVPPGVWLVSVETPDGVAVSRYYRVLERKK